MDPEYQKEYLKMEKKHWWFKSRQFWLKTLCTNPKETIIEVGAGSAINLKGIQGKKTAIDINDYGKEEAEKQGITYIIGDAKKLPFKDNSFDTIIALDILEHIEDDMAAIKEWERVAKKRIILSVPAYQWLWSHHDEINHHKRRYTQKQLRELIKKTNLKIKKISYWNCTLFPLAIIKRKLCKENKITTIPQILNDMFQKIAEREFKNINKNKRYPFGSSIVTIIEK